MADPMDVPPVDHGSDRYDYVEVAGHGVVPSGSWWDRLIAAPCPDCRANVFARHVGGDPGLRASWHVTFAHDDSCPALADRERGGE